MKALEEIKTEMAKEYGYEHWASLPDLRKAHLVDEVIIRYARKRCQASLNKAAGNSKVKGDLNRFYQYCQRIDKESITDPSNIVLL